MGEETHIRQLKGLVEDLVSSGKDILDEVKLKQLKTICRRTDEFVIELYQQLKKHLKKKHAEVRLSAFQILNEVFRRSHCFRELVVGDFMTLAESVLQIDPQNPLPRPKAVADKLQKTAIQSIHEWHQEFKDGYPTLEIGYDMLRDCKQVDFVELTILSEQERIQLQEERRKEEESARKKVQKVEGEMAQLLPELQDCIVEFRNCFKLLIPEVSSFFIWGNSGDTDSQNLQLQSSAQNVDNNQCSEETDSETFESPQNFTIHLEDLKKIHETADNEDLICSLRESFQLMNKKYLSAVRKWEQIIQPISGNNVALIKRIIDLKRSVEAPMKFYTSLKIIRCKQMDISDSDDDFVEAPFDDPRVLQARESEAALLGLSTDGRCGIGITSSGSGMSDHCYVMQPSTSRDASGSIGIIASVGPKSLQTKIQSLCPDDYLKDAVVPPSRCHNPLAGVGQVWTANADIHDREGETTGGILGIATKRVNYHRVWEPIRWACRAPLPSGRLCPRQDREKCPLHGIVVPRDELGVPLKAEDAEKERAAKQKYEQDHPNWQDPGLLADIQAETGIDLEIQRGRQRKRNKNANLTDLRALENTPRKRLARKVLNKRAVQRVNAALCHESGGSVSGIFRFGSS